jgi:lipoprotein NlpD
LESADQTYKLAPIPKMLKKSLPGFFCCDADLSIGGRRNCCSSNTPANGFAVLFREFETKLYPIIGRLFGLTLLIIVGCGGDKSTAPVIEQGTSLRQSAEYRIVAAGDTLYSIAWEAGRNHKELAAWNGIAPPYTIQPGQKLRLVPPGANPASAKPAKTNEAARKSGKAEKNNRPGSGQTEKIKRATADFGPWSWPAEGRILNYYGQNRGNKGLDIDGKKGQGVRAAAAGKVVYQGSGLRGYGKLIILKHNDDFLSAYAHNDNVYVKEGDMVKRGQQIAEMGTSGADRVKLHFEIRRGGVPVDPLLYLPKK